ncbi:MAG: DegT/DnrJ/EryC1/StrS family aminotransferase [bacterium]
MIPLARPCFDAEEDAAVAEVLRSGWVAQGPTTAKLEHEFAQIVGVPHAIATSSCTTALHLAVIACGIRPGDEVVLPSFTFPATANAVLYEGAAPVLVDIDPRTLNVDLGAAERAIGPRTKAVLAVHLFGAPCEIAKLRALCDARGLALIEDAACAVGTEFEGRPIGSFGDVACFSFHARKIVTCGEGGMITTADPEKAALLASLRTHGADRPAEARQAEGLAPGGPEYVRLGYNYRLSDIQSAIARVQLRKLPAFLDERERLARRYDDAFRTLGGIRLPPRREGARHSFQSYVVVLERDAPVEPSALMASLAAQGISTRVGTYAVHRQPYLRGKPGIPTRLPASEEAAERSIALPLFNGLKPADQDTVIAAIRRAWSARA